MKLVENEVYFVENEVYKKSIDVYCVVIKVYCIETEGCWGERSTPMINGMINAKCTSNNVHATYIFESSTS